MGLLKETDVRPDKAIAELVESVIKSAETEWAPLKYEGQYPVGGFGITELRPKHVWDPSGLAASLAWGSVSWGAELSIATAANAYFNWINITLTDMAYILPTGVFNLESTPQVTEMGPSANGQDLPTVNLEHLYALDVARAWLEMPFAARPNNNFKVQLVARVRTGTERIGLMGYCIAKRAYLILR